MGERPVDDALVERVDDTAGRLDPTEFLPGGSRKLAGQFLDIP
jgi:hypothetical protein